MPTGYTANVVDGRVTDFRTFALDCARAFGACVELRDEGGGGEKIPEEFHPSTYHLEACLRDQQRQRDVCAMSDAECEAAALRAYTDEVARRSKSLQRDADENERLYSMLRKVESWVPPTTEHIELKNFMIQQLTVSLNQHYERPMPVLLSGAVWRQAELARLEKSIAYLKAEHAKEEDRARGRTRWVRELRDSLPEPTRG